MATHNSPDVISPGEIPAQPSFSRRLQEAPKLRRVERMVLNGEPA